MKALKEGSIDMTFPKKRGAEQQLPTQQRVAQLEGQNHEVSKVRMGSAWERQELEQLGVNMSLCHFPGG